MNISRGKLLVTTLSAVAVMGLTGCMNNPSPSSDKGTFLEAYSNIALDNYSDALADAKALQKAIDNFAKKPTTKSLKEAKAAWLTSRESYGQSEIFRLSNGPIDAEEGWVADMYGALEGQINAWPLDENMIDYTKNAKGKRTKGNIIDSRGMFNPGGEDSKAVNVDNITVEAITELNENGGEANVATGYHAVEFLLWGQDQDYSSFVKDGITKGALKAGGRPLKDFTKNRNAKRRLAYLKAATSKIVSDLEVITGAWEKGGCQTDGKGCYREAFLGKGKNPISATEAKKQVFAGMGVFIKSELANERIAVAVLTPSEEDEHSCFSDNTHRDIVTNYQGFKNILMGTYKGVDYGKAPIDMVSGADKKRIMELISKIETKIASINSLAETSRHFDYQIRPNDPQAKVIVKLKNELRKLGDEMVHVAKANGINLTVDDVTDAEETKL
ncbi:MAG: imelysin [Campylobacterales bacterium]|nr:imelysin [Campylobacterales bacterium]